jgi:signal recognition particle subunit SRP72
VDVDALEAAASRGGGGMRKKEGGRKRGGDEMDADGKGTEVKKKARRKRAPRFPKGYDPEQPGGGVPPPEPERWLPKWQRSDFKRRKATSAMRKAGEVVKGSQGAGKVDAALDRSNAPLPTKEAAKPALPVRPSGKKGKGKK